MFGDVIDETLLLYGCVCSGNF